jgi:tRNA C32,U32 (ribose-2'-O)-methylase TrmJ
MGSEGKGLSNSVINLCDHLIKIPLYGKIESLNVSVACGTILYEMVRTKKLLIKEALLIQLDHLLLYNCCAEVDYLNLSE